MLTKASPRSPNGAIYFITNGPDENMVVSAAINADGTLRLDRAVASGGRGLHGHTANGNTGADGLFSQGSVQVSSKKNLLATVNAGSNTISLFSIDPRRPTILTPLGDPISSEGEFPQSVAFSSDGSRLCALNGGAINGVNCFSVDSKLGLVTLPNTLRYLGLNQTNPPNGPPGTLSQIHFSEDDSKLVVSYKGATGPGFLATWDVAKDGSLAANYTQVNVPGAMVPFSLTPITGENAFLLTDPGIGFDVVDFSGKGRGSANTVPGNGATCWSTYSTKTGNYYTVDVAANTIREVQLDSNLKPSAVASYTVANGTSPIDPEVATVGGKDYLYVLGAASEVVDVFALSGPAKAKQIATVDVAGPARAAGLSLSPGSLQGMATYVRSGY
ncbi:hypothetical protein DICSQDRAFT_65282 [Dichomitus squalens LYAD-421 SS1]|uniref:Lactonase, 7-bladed beta-propeller-domain-containing protein n=1 Tax=Dichomitus squalens (strain LYAD-421) TaxID=732165 RepID=R7STF2_DICSQ|nr:uncharacterized protein DICSQDRAFT_65282 [Dichomitus squalens LYAD-421 SS1]EJF59346.1 hypothetical protein DICSQDRAFT_65282 [Dichomitus squalens LYAD-421 SS1]